MHAPLSRELAVEGHVFCDANHHSRDLSAEEARDPIPVVSIRVPGVPPFAAAGERESGGNIDSFE